MKQYSVAMAGYEEGPYYNRDIKVFQENYGLSTTELADVFCRGGMGASAFKKRISRDDDLLPPSLQILFRMYSRYPELIPFPERIVASEFFENDLGGQPAIATRFHGVLFGVDRNSGYNWARDSYPIAEVTSTMMAARKLKQIKKLNNQELLKELINILNYTTKALSVNPMKTGGWRCKVDSTEILKFEINTVSDNAVQNRGRRVSLAGTVQTKSTTMAQLISMAREQLCEENS